MGRLGSIKDQRATKTSTVEKTRVTTISLSILTLSKLFRNRITTAIYLCFPLTNFNGELMMKSVLRIALSMDIAST